MRSIRSRIGARRIGAKGFDVFAVEPDQAQLAWRRLPMGLVTLRVGSSSVELTSNGEAGVVNLGGLRPGHRALVTVSHDAAEHAVGVVHSSLPPSGAELFRFATINDTHVGTRSWGRFPTIREADGDRHPERCLRSAVDDAVEWGAQLIIVKGDVTQRGREEEWIRFCDALEHHDVPIYVLLGNHDVGRKAFDPYDLLNERGLVAPRDRVWHHDVPGTRIIGVHTPHPVSGKGRLPDDVANEVVELARTAPGSAFVALHHYPQRWRLPNIWPTGIPGPEASAFLNRLAEANPASFVTSGHSHRHRRHHHGPLTLSEIGSTKDYPGAWAGYVVHEGGLRQVVRRVSDQWCVEWCERTRSAWFGAWGRWAPGIRSHRCFSVHWRTRQR